MMIKKSLILFIASAFAFSVCSVANGYSNPFTIPNSWTWNSGNFYGEGDPYILKFNGTYYLYVSTVDDKDGIKVWTSENLVDWTYAGLCSTDPVTKAAYAPEVIYWNGQFYMYTSPAGNGHYVLQSSSPLGPFTVQTGNTGNSIDGHVFIDDDGQWYFYRAASNDIIVHPMSDPYSFGAGITTGARMNGWTEGPTILKRNSKYFMTYTGNHVWNAAYRVNYAKSTNATSGFTASADDNPVLVSTEGSLIGTGHNSIVQGPDLDSYYMVYHNNNKPGRKMNIDRIAWNNEKMLVLGPTTAEQEKPKLPDFSDRFRRASIGSNWTNVNGGNWGIYDQKLMWQNTISNTTWYRQVTSSTTAANYTAVFHTKQVKQGSSANPLHGAVFSYTDENNYGIAVLSRTHNRLETFFNLSGVGQGWQSSALPAGFDYTKWHKIRVEKSGSEFTFYVDGMLKQTRSASGIGGGKIGVTTRDVHADFGYTAFSNDVGGSSDWNAAKPIPGRIDAVHFIKDGEGSAYHDTTGENIGGAYRNTAVDIRLSSSEGQFVTGWNQVGEWKKYRVNVAETGFYGIDVRVATTFDDARFRLWSGSIDLTGETAVPNTGGWESWQTITQKGLYLTQGIHELEFEVTSGEFDFAYMRFHRAADVAVIHDDFQDGNDNGWTRFEGNWSVNGGYRSLGGTFAKTTIGNTRWADYIVEADIKLIESSGSAGIMVRVNNPSNGKHLVNNPDYQQGYYAHITANGVHLGKFNFGWKSLATSAIPLPAGAWRHMKVIVKGANIRVYVGDMNVPKINYTDTAQNVFTHGKVGLRTHFNESEFDNFHVEPVSSGSSSSSSSSLSSSSSSVATQHFIEAEAYTAMVGVQTEPATDVGGGLNVGWIDVNDWMAYAGYHFPTTGTYRVEYRVASPNGSTLSLDLNGGQSQLGQLNVPATGGWQSWTTISHDVHIEAGSHDLGIFAAQGGWNINWFRITKL